MPNRDGCWIQNFQLATERADWPGLGRVPADEQALPSRAGFAASNDYKHLRSFALVSSLFRMQLLHIKRFRSLIDRPTFQLTTSFYVNHLTSKLFLTSVLKETRMWHQTLINNKKLAIQRIDRTFRACVLKTFMNRTIFFNTLCTYTYY